jgi:epsilon-lactone hydrolase
MASEQYKKLMSLIPGGNVDHRDPVELVRAKMHAIHPTSASPGTWLETVDLDGIEATWIATPENRSSDRVVVHVHGGAFVSTVVQHYLDYGEHLSRHLGARVVCFQYRWAPEHPYPAALDDTLKAWRALRARGVRADRTAFLGDSCGGGIALAAACRLRDTGEPMPACIVGLTPWLDSEQTGDAAVSPRGKDPFVSPEWIRARFKDYAGASGNLHDPLISPLRANLAGLPPIYLAVGQIDTTADDSTRLLLRAGRDGASVTVDLVNEMVHGYVGLCGQFPEATDAMQRMGDWVKRRIP